MKWLLKAAMQKVLSVFPRPENLNYLLQSKVTHKFPLPKDEFMWRVEHALTHFKAIKAHFGDVSNLRGYEFGAGWDFIVPLTLYAAGINDQTLIDIRHNLKPELVRDTIWRLNEYRAEIEQKHGVSLRELKSDDLANLQDQLCRDFHILYYAPCDAGKTPCEAKSFDFITSTYTLEHIPRLAIVSILRECYRILKPTGIVSSLIDMKDHYAGFDHEISDYNYLQFPGWMWRLFNSPLHYQNRLRYSDYKGLTRDAGFKTIEEWIDQPKEKDLAALKSLKLAPEFAHYSKDDLAAKRLGLVVERV